MLISNFGQYLSFLAIVWAGYLLLSRFRNVVAKVKIPALNFVLNFLRKVTLFLALITSGAVVMFALDVKEVLAYVRESVGSEIELFLRNCIDALFNTRSFFAVIQLLVHGFVAISTTVFSAVMFVGQLACLCLILLYNRGRSTKLIPQKQYSAQTFTTNIYNHQRKYFIRA